MSNPAKTTTSRTTLDDILEKDWQRTVVQLAKTLGYMTFHVFDSRRSTHGWPDLVCVRDRLVMLELKRERGRATPEQVDWLVALNRAGVEAYLARPRHLESVGAILGPRNTQSWHEARGILLQELDSLFGQKAA